MLSKARGVVTAISRADAESIHLRVEVEGFEGTDSHPAVAYPALTGPVAVGDVVVLNTTARDLRLGTGGVDFVLHNESRPLPETVGGRDGHIVKLRYTPLQHAIQAVEQDPRYAHVWETAESLGGIPVVVGGLHSQIGPVAAAVKAARPDARITYVQTDAAALPLGFSSLVRNLKAAGLLDATLTAGQAFGGDYECVTVASALMAARHIARADVIVVCQGPGNAGTGTRYGFSGIEQGLILDLAGQLGGTPIGVLRLSLADTRDRHHGLSHHSVTALGRLCHGPARIAFPSGDNVGVAASVLADLRQQVLDSSIAARHQLIDADGAPGLALLDERGITVRSMGRAPGDDSVFFHAAAAAGALAGSLTADTRRLPSPQR